MEKDRKKISRKLVLPIILVVIAIIFECILSNYNLVNMTNANYIPEYDITEEEEFVCISSKNIDFPVKNIVFEYPELQHVFDIKNANIDNVISYKLYVCHDENSLGYYEYDEKWGISCGKSRINLNARNIVHGIIIKIPKDQFVMPGNMYFNDDAVRFSFARFVIIVALMILVMLFAQLNMVYSFDKKKTVFIVTLISILLVLGIIFVERGYHGIIDRMEIEGGFSDDYGEITYSLAHGSTSFIHWVPDEKFLALDDYYDFSERTEKGISYPFDAAYYNGKFTICFGITPVLEFFMPCYLLFHICPTTATVNNIYIILSMAMIAVLFYKFFGENNFSTKVSQGVYILSIIAAEFACGILQLLRNMKWDLATTCGMAHCLVALVIAMSITDNDKFSRSKNFALGMMLGLMVLSKPTYILFYVIIAYILFRNNAVKLNRIGYLLVPLCVQAIFQMWYNWSRFGSVFCFGNKYQVGSNAMLFCKVSFLQFVKGVVAMICSVPKLEIGSFPYLHAATCFDPPITGMSFLSLVDTNVGLLFIPLIWILLIAIKPVCDKKQRSLIVLTIAVAVAEIIISFSYISVNDEYMIWPRLLMIFCSIKVWTTLIDSSDEYARILLEKMYVLALMISILIMLPCSISNHTGLFASMNHANVWLRHVVEFWNY